ncbi:PEPxxWA-CTERM sorting domain-containing protein [Phenylobacterium sp.]|uniref:PEPxxWA-CTERM sorting domain-containing protein n=1 Tax=Phenylobacterium sp. TaxID=1871053 RepID=UPI00122A4023|nr:PEPxxWA-CTERM sorting domain-containing protein [Phenylobacterium sp.]TAL28502.1 MAG: discoidin domain-containing protein [Phenylobacterium sp.]
MNFKTTLVAAGLSAIVLGPGPAAAATVVNATRIEITSAIPDWIQIAEVFAFEFGSLDNVASAAEGGTASATSSGFGGPAHGAIDGNASPSYGSHFYHSGSPGGGEKLTINLGRTATLDSLRIVGRNDLRGRDFWNVSVFDAADTVLFSGQLDARTTANFDAVAKFDAPSVGGIPEPSTWAMMILGFGAAGAAMRSRRRVAVV